MGALSEQRSQKWDILKFILIFLVVLGHAAEYYTSGNEHMRSLIFFIYIFHMPLFIFVSGLFAGKTVKNKRFDKLLGYVVIYIFLKIFFHFVKILIGRNPEFNLWVEGGVPWFMLALFMFNAITIVLQKAPKAVVLTLSIVLACVAGFFAEIRDFLAISRVIVFYPFFYIGYCTDRSRLEEFCEGRYKKIIAAAVLILVAIFVFVQGDEIYTLRYLLTGRNPYGTLGKFAPAGVWLRLIYYLVSSAISLCVIIVTPAKTKFGICSKFGQRTLAVYGLHYGALYLIFDYFGLKPFFTQAFGAYDEWIIVPLSVIITLLFSLKFFNTALLYLMNLPATLIRKLRKRRQAGAIDINNVK